MLERSKNAFRGYPENALSFLKEIERNNNRPWFQDNKSRYEDLIRTPSLDFIEAMGTRIEKKLSPHFLAVRKKVGGSLMRVYRDTRFSKDKTPYKTNVGIQFRHVQGKDVHAPGFYVHLEPGNCFLGAGIWRPESKSLLRIREFIADNPNAWRSALSVRGFKKNWRLIGDSLVRPPKGFDKEHPLIADLKRKSFIARYSFPDKHIYNSDFCDFSIKYFSQAEELMDCLCFAIEVNY